MAKLLKKIILTILAIIIVLNFLGLVIETIFTLGWMQTDIATIRTLSPITTLISIATLVTAGFLWWTLKKENRQVFWWWHAFIVISIIGVAYKWKAPTALAVFMPNYFVIMPIIILIIWAALFNYFRKFTKSASSSRSG